MPSRVIIPLISFVLCISCLSEICLSEDMTSVPELVKKMYDYRMAIENIQVKVTLTSPVNTQQQVAEKIKDLYFFAYNKGKIRLDKTMFDIHQEQRLQQHLSTPEFYFNRHHSPNPNNDGNSLLFGSPLPKPVDTFDPRRLGTDTTFFSHVELFPFNHDKLLQNFYSPFGKNFTVTSDTIDGQKLLKVSCQIDDSGNKGESSIWIDPQRGYNLVLSKFDSEMHDIHQNYAVTLEKYPSAKGGTWFPKETYFKYRMKDMRIEERAVFDSVVFDAQDDKMFTLAGLDIPVGYRVKYKNEGMRTWNGTELVEDVPYAIGSAKQQNRQRFLIVNAVILFLIALTILIRLLRYRKS